MTKDVGLTFSVGDITPHLQLVLSNTIRSGDTKYRIQCSGHNQSKSRIVFCLTWDFYLFTKVNIF